MQKLVLGFKDEFSKIRKQFISSDCNQTEDIYNLKACHCTSHLLNYSAYNRSPDGSHTYI